MNTESTVGLFGRRGPLSHATTRLGIRHVLNTNTSLTADQVTALQGVLADSDMVAQVAAMAGQAGFVEPTAAPTPGKQRDWTSFFQALGDFIVKIMPAIMQIFSMFGGGGLLPKPTPTPTPTPVVPTGFGSMPENGCEDNDPRVGMIPFPAAWAFVQPVLLAAGHALWPEIRAAGDRLFSYDG